MEAHARWELFSSARQVVIVAEILSIPRPIQIGSS